MTVTNAILLSYCIIIMTITYNISLNSNPRYNLEAKNINIKITKFTIFNSNIIILDIVIVFYLVNIFLDINASYILFKLD